MRVILFTGKGGVGKTSVAAATAVRCGALGHRTLIMSTDPAHSLGDSFEAELASQPVKVTTNVWAHEVSALHEMERHWTKLHDYAARVFATQGLDEVVAEEVANPPGMDEVASLMWIKHYAETADYDLLIVDCAPTGETLQLLMFPDAARWWLDKVFPWQRKAMKVARPLLQRAIDLPLPTDDIYASVKDLLIDIDGMKKVLVDSSVTSMRIVLNLEKMVVKEAKRAYMYLSLFGYNTDAVVVNRTLPSSLEDDLFKKWKEVAQRYEAEVATAFHPLPIFHAPLFDEEVVGERMLRKMAEVIYKGADPSSRFHSGNSQTIERVGGEYVLSLKVPFATKEEIGLSREAGDLFVTVGNYKREISLPRALSSRPTLGATIEGDELKVRFGPR
ncbi:MAG TPA: ArsA family ATPase [Candidatus Acidoferrales bacterium]|nr:ArsA family ATPase [Candidatus Acidoferrales bacterium]